MAFRSYVVTGPICGCGNKFFFATRARVASSMAMYNLNNWPITYHILRSIKILSDFCYISILSVRFRTVGLHTPSSTNVQDLLPMRSSILTPSYFPVCLNTMIPTVRLKWAGHEISHRSLGDISTSTADLSLTILPQRSILTNSSDRSTWRQCSMKKATGKKEGWKSNFEPYRGMGKNDPVANLFENLFSGRYGTGEPDAPSVDKAARPGRPDQVLYRSREGFGRPSFRCVGDRTHIGAFGHQHAGDERLRIFGVYGTRASPREHRCHS